MNIFIEVLFKTNDDDQVDDESDDKTDGAER